MGYLGDTIKALATTFATIFRKPVTYEFPDVIRPRAERFRASFALTDDEHGEISCVACLACVKICPSQVIAVKGGGKKESPVTGKKRAYPDDFVLDLSACIGCELCVQVCNSDSIVMVRETETPSFDREGLVLTMDRLRENAKLKKLGWANGTVLQGMQEPPKPPKPAAAAKPAEAKPTTDATKPEAAKPAEAKPAETKAEPAKEATKDVAAKPESAKDVAVAKPAFVATKPDTAEKSDTASPAAKAAVADKKEPEPEAPVPVLVKESTRTVVATGGKGSA